jgi:hypothetical protein
MTSESIIGEWTPWGWAHWFTFDKFQVLILARRTVILIESFSGIPQSLHANTLTVSGTGLRSLSSESL